MTIATQRTIQLKLFHKVSKLIRLLRLKILNELFSQTKISTKLNFISCIVNFHLSLNEPYPTQSIQVFENST